MISILSTPSGNEEMDVQMLNENGNTIFVINGERMTRDQVAALTGDFGRAVFQQLLLIQIHQSPTPY